MRKIRGWIFLILPIIPLMLGMFFVAPTTLNGGGGANSFIETKIKNNLIDSKQELENPTYKNFDDYFTDFEIPETLEGEGTESQPYQINSTEDFLLLSTIDFSWKFVSINCDIVLNDELFDVNGKPTSGDGVVYTWKPIMLGRQATIFGNNHKIKGLYINDQTQSYVGLFGMRDSKYGLDLKRTDSLNFENVYLCGNQRVYTIAEAVNNMTNCKVLSGTLKGKQNVAGMTISVSNQLSNCENHAAIYSESSGYGIVNVVYATCKTISGCKNYGNLDVNTGCGIVGTTKCEKVENCENYGNINATSSYCGGIVGMTDFYAHFSNCKNYGDIYDTYMAYGGIVACAQTSVTMISCENYGNIWGKSNVKGQLIGWVRSVRSGEAIFIIDKCKGVVDSESAMLGNISSSDSGLNIVVKMNRCEIISLANTLSQYVLISASNGNVDLEVNNVCVESNLISGKINLFGAFSALTKAKIKNIILDLNSKNETNVQAFVVDNKGTSQVEVEGVLILNNEKSCFFGDDFSGFYVDFRTGKISLKAMSFKGFYQGRVSEEFLKNKGYEKKVA